MRFVLPRTVGLFGLFAAVALLAGCGSKAPKTVKVSGRLLEKGNPIKLGGTLPPGDPGIRLTFNLFEGTVLKDAQDADLDLNTGSFEVKGPTGKGILPGKYRISVHVGASGSPDRLKERFTAENSPIFRDINADTTDLVIDISKPQG